MTSYITGLGGTPGAGWFTDSNGSPRLWVATETWGLPVNAGQWSGSGGGTGSRTSTTSSPPGPRRGSPSA